MSPSSTSILILQRRFTLKTLSRIIRVLPEDVANKIAAGEVVERPASVVKELVENSIDAGATEIEVSVKHGGLTFIRVADNGCGMSPEDAKLSLIRHATSKIESVEDIFSIDTFGFRGEALPSISAVSKFRLATRVQGESVGFELSIEGGKIVQESEKGIREGTIIEVKDLFFNTPARRKFVKTERTELSRITEALTLLALAYPEIKFLFSDEKKTIIDVKKSQSLRDRVKTLYDAGYEERLIDFSGELSGVTMEGLVGKPELAQVHRRDQIFFINKRPIKSVSLSFALSRAFHGLVMDGKFPVGIIFIDVDPKQVDVNVHPTKREVKLSNEKAIQNLMIQIIREQLLGEDLYPQMRVTEDKRIVSTNKYEQEFMKDNASSYEVREGLTNLLGKETIQGLDLQEQSFEKQTDFRDANSNQDQLQLGGVRVLGHIHSSFIVGEYEGGLVVIDQHAAHERVQYESVLSSLEKSKVETQGLLMPITFNLKVNEEAHFKHVLPFLNQVGFSIEPFGDRTYAIQSIPAFIKEAAVEDVLRGYLERSQMLSHSDPLKEKQEEVSALIACKSRSVKAKDRMVIEEMESLVELLNKTQSPFTCPHGRPVLLKLTLHDFEKHFKRI